MEPFKVFVSSTSRDLTAERKAVAGVLRKIELPATAMENWDAIPPDPTNVSLDSVTKCDVFVGIYAFRYGFIPPGSATSITEQEYEIARREGKRCLCYFKDESEAPPIEGSDPFEPKTSRDLLVSFKERIEKELVRAHFTSPEDLTTKLALDISRLQQGYLPGYSHGDLLARWAKRGTEKRNQLVHGGSSGHTPLQPSPLLISWSKFIREMAWHEVMQRELRSISTAAQKIPGLSALGLRAAGFAERIGHGDEFGRLYSYNTILVELDKAITEMDISETEDVVRQLRNNIERAQRRGSYSDPETQNKLFRARDLLRDLETMRGHVKRPVFGKCFPVIGSLGSGRTHFIASLLELTPHNSDEEYSDGGFNFLVLLLDQSSTKSLEETILEGINKASGLQWRTLDEFDRFLRYTSIEGLDCQIRLGIAIDDLQRWLMDRNKISNAVEELTRFIEEHTHLASLFWLFTLQDTSYSQVEGLNAFLKNYSYFQPEIQPEPGREFLRRQNSEKTFSHFSGWLVLDDLNRDAEFGLRLIERGLELQGAAPPDLEMLRENKAVLRNLLKPFIASILLDLHFEKKLNLQHLATLSYMSFVEKFWEKRKGEFTTEYNRLRSGETQDATYNDWSQALKLIAETLSQTGEFNPLQKDLEALVLAAAKKEDHPSPERMVTAAMAALIKSGFLRRYQAADPQMPVYEVQRIGFEFEPFWELRLADHIRAWKSLEECDEAAATDDLINWFGIVESGEIEEGVLEFLLLLLDDEAGTDSRRRSFVNFLQRLAIEREDLPEEAVWFSGVNATLNSQELLMTLAGREEKEFQNRRLLHSIMYFLVEALPEINEPAERFRILQPHYDVISRESLAAYFFYIARRLLVQADDNKAVVRSMHCFNNSEVMGIAPGLASLTVDVLFDKAKEGFGELNDESLKSIVKTMLDYLKARSEDARNDYANRGRVNRWERFFYREWVLRFFCTRLVGLKGVEAYHMLARQHWYHPRKLNISPPIAVEMHREANFALGDWYRMRRTKEKTELYLNLVRELVDSDNFRDRETAFYLIRHSEPTQGKKGLAADDVFAPMLRKIFLDPHLSRTVSRFYDSFRINLRDFRNLEILRDRKLDQANRPAGRRGRRQKQDGNQDD